MDPLISCLMVTQPGREPLIQKAVDCFHRQSYDHRELVIVHGAPSAQTPGENNRADRFEQFLKTEVDFARIVPRKPGRSLGELRNIALDEARGELVCQWDDDDQYHPDRLLRQWETLREAQAEACFLTSQLHYFSRSRELFVRDTGRRGIEGTVMHRRNLPARYPALKKEEDTIFMRELITQHRSTLLQGDPWLYLRVFHGNNTWGEEHHRRMMRSTWNVDLLQTWKDEITAQLEQYDLERPVVVRGPNGRAFTVPVHDKILG